MEHTKLIISFADDPAQCWSLGGCETWRAKIYCRNHNRERYFYIKASVSDLLDI